MLAAGKAVEEDEMRVRVLSRRAVEDGGAWDADAIISIRPSAAADLDDLDLAVAQAVDGEVDAMLVLRFDDIATPSYGPYVGPTMREVGVALDFARAARERTPGGLLVVHCEHGVSRSAAVALAVLADELGDNNEAEAVGALLRDDIDNRMHPNPLIVSMTDAALFRYGRLDAALAAISPRYVKWRDHWREVALDPERHWEQARKVRIRRKGEQRAGADDAAS